MHRDDGQWFQRCADCESPLEANVSHPVYTERDQNGDLRLYSFCDEECKRRWLDARQG